MPKKKSSGTRSNGSALRFAAQLWATAHKMRGSKDASEYKRVRLGPIRGAEANLGPGNDDSFRSDLHPDLEADFILANPPFNMSDWGGESLRQDVRWKFGMPVNTASCGWIQDFIPNSCCTGWPALTN